MNQKLKLAGVVLLLIVLIAGSTLIYQNLKENYGGSKNLVAVKEESTEAQTENTEAQTENTEAQTENTEAQAESAEAQEDSTETQDQDSEYSMYLDFTVLDMDGNEVTLESKIGKPLVINFWASWCPPCKGEMPDFEEVYQEKGEDITFMMVNMTDGGRETIETAKSFLNDSGYTFPIYFDTEQSAAGAYGISSIPTTIFIDAKGQIIAGSTGAIDKETLLKGIDMILKENNE
ncbi:MAG: TlpA disulfide reductase family protein [Lachnospiraceae bacterium]|nr:TlpA disulfide reductase family protein [Lachnospiraceae bacterium]